MVKSIVKLNQRRIKKFHLMNFKNQSKMLKGKLEIVHFESALKDRNRWCSSNVIQQAVPYCRCGTTKGA